MLINSLKLLDIRGQIWRRSLGGFILFVALQSCMKRNYVIKSFVILGMKAFVWKRSLSCCQYV